MKRMQIFMTGILLIALHFSSFSQQLTGANADVIEPYHLAITYYKTTNLVFPYAIKSVDRGSKDVLAQKVEGLENILNIKAGRKGFEETNLTVITADGMLYSYVLSYSDNPQVLNLQFHIGNKTSGILFSEGNTTESKLKEISEMVALKERSVFGKKDKGHGIKLQLEGLYVKGDVMYCQVSLLNRSNLDYDISQLRFFIRDRKKPKRTASQEREINPLFVHNDSTKIKGKSEQVFVFALPKFTIPDQKYLAVQVMEKNGGRHLELKVGNPRIIKSRLIDQ